ncbi:hypothetical protein CesoFtcFv8_014219 [Champsocephalus esox]|nr:hypothetical protein CesoFtcFv8_014219 [Champsocephalus esox]
MWWPPIR